MDDTHRFRSMTACRATVVKGWSFFCAWNHLWDGWRMARSISEIKSRKRRFYRIRTPPTGLTRYFKCISLSIIEQTVCDDMRGANESAETSRQTVQLFATTKFRQIPFWFPRSESNVVEVPTRRRRHFNSCDITAYRVTIAESIFLCVRVKKKKYNRKILRYV